VHTIDGAALRFGILGPVELRGYGRVLSLTSTKQQALLGAGLLHANMVVSAARLVTAIWGERPPQSAPALVQTYVSALRRLIEPFAPDTDGPIVTRSPGYVVRVPDGDLDVHDFERLSAEGEVAAAAGDHRRASTLFREALGHWRGPAFDGLDTSLFRAAAARLDEARLAVLERRIDADAQVGPTGALVAELTELVAAHPSRERLRGLLMRALYQLGRQAEALQVYQDGYLVLRDELGLEPGPELRELHRRILTADPTLRAPARIEAAPAAAPPRQLPLPPAQFVARAAETARLRTALHGAAESDGPALVAISGPAGSGKTALALAVAGAVRQLFPDGQLFVPVRASGPDEPTPVCEALAMVLRSLGTGAVGQPGAVDELAARLRTTMIGRRILLVLDDVASAAEVRPFLAVHPGCAVLVTSRPRLASLDTSAAVDLGPLPPVEALRLLVSAVGAERVAAEPAAADEIVRACDGLPLAVRAAGARLVSRPRWRLADLADRLLDDRRRLDELSVGDLDVRTSIHGSYRRLAEPDADVFRRIGRLDGAEFSVEVLTRLLDDPPDAERIADRLVDAQLLEHLGAGGSGQRYRMPSLTSLFARELTAGDG
jgi:DNA-binding SARP family transcriptional activator